MKMIGKMGFVMQAGVLSPDLTLFPIQIIPSSLSPS